MKFEPGWKIEKPTTGVPLMAYFVVTLLLVMCLIEIHAQAIQRALG